MIAIVINISIILFLGVFGVSKMDNNNISKKRITLLGIEYIPSVITEDKILQKVKPVML